MIEMNNNGSTHNKKEQKPLNRILYQDGIEIRRLVREAIIPEIKEAIKDNNFKDGLKEALGIKEK